MPMQYRTMQDLTEKTPSVLRAAQRADVVITVRGALNALLRHLSKQERERLQLLACTRMRQLLTQALAMSQQDEPSTLTSCLRARWHERGDLPVRILPYVVEGAATKVRRLQRSVLASLRSRHRCPADPS